jgi:DNA-binding transcriptional LysR family regulator
MANIRGIDLNLLAVFDALYDARSVTRAAVRLSLTQPTVSGMLQRLRHAFSDPLFVRTSHGVLPTPRAEALAGPIKDLLSNARSLIVAEAFDPKTAEATLRLCGSDYLQYAVIGPLIRELRRVAPRIKVLVVPRPAEGVTDMLSRGEIDFYVCARELVIPDLPSRHLFDDRYICVTRKKHPLKGRRVTIEQLSAFDHVVSDPTGRSLSGPIDLALASKGRARRVAVAVPTLHMLFDVLESDDFVAFMPERVVRDRRADLKTFETDLPTPLIEVFASWHPRVGGDAQHKWLRELAAKVSRTPRGNLPRT